MSLDDGGYTTALALLLFGIDDVADCTAGDQLPNAFVSVVNEKFDNEFEATNGDSGRDIPCY